MKKLKVNILVIILIVMGLVSCIIGFNSTSATSTANIKFKRVKSLYVPGSYYDSNGLNSVQSIVYTGNYFAFMLTSTKADDANENVTDPKKVKATNAIYYYKWIDGKWVHKDSYYIKGLKYGHGNDMAYNTKTKTVAVTYYDYTYTNANGSKGSGMIAFLDPNNNFKLIKKVPSIYYYGSIGYDKSTDKYYLSRSSASTDNTKFFYTICNGQSEIESGKCFKNTSTYKPVSVFTTNKSGLTGQGLEAHQGFVYKINYSSANGALGYRGGEIDVVDTKNNYNNTLKLRFKCNQLSSSGVNDIGEIENVEFVGDTPYFLFNGRSITNKSADGYNTFGRIYVPDYSPRNVNAKVLTSIKTNNSAAIKNIDLKANFKSTSPKIDSNIKLNSNKYTLSNISINKIGKYNVDVKQKKGSNVSSNWSIDNSTKKATINVKYSLSINNLTYSTSFANGDNVFNNNYTYSAINVPISVKQSTTKQDSSYKTPTLKATLYKGNEKIETVNTASGKYTFKNQKIDKKGTYEYTIKQENSGSSVDGIFVNSIDTSVIKVTITVTEGETALKYSVKYSKAGFTNKVTANFNEVSNNVSLKIKTNKDDASAPTPSTKAILTKSNKTIDTVTSSDNKYNFVVKVKSPGVYKYVIKQDTSISGQNMYSYNLDKSSINLTVTASISGNALVSSYKLDKQTFTNKITTNYDRINIPLSVKINTEKNDEEIPTPVTTATITNGNNSETLTSIDGYYNYTASISKPGTYNYSIVQKDLPDTDDYLYDIDNSKLNYKVVVISNNGYLQYSISPQQNEFTNEVKRPLEQLKINLAVGINTTLSDNSVPTPQTQAILSSNNEVIKTVNSNKRKYTFSNIEIVEAGTYTYTISQLNPGEVQLGGCQCLIDNKTITVTVVVTENNDKLVPRITYSSKSFDNTATRNYESISVPINLEIDSVKDSDSIAIPTTSASIYLEDEKKATVNSNDSKYKFNLSYNAPGVYTYEIKQNNRGTNKTDDYSYYIDDDTKTCVVTITATDQGTLTSSVEFLYNDSEFENHYVKSYKAINVPIEIGIETIKKSESTPIPNTTAVLIDDEEEIDTKSNSNNKYSYEVELLIPGTYVYSIKQLNSGNSTNGVFEYNIDDEIIIAEIRVREENSKLAYDIEYSSTSFVNEVITHYEPVTVPVQVSVNNKNNNIDTYALLCNDEKVIEKVKEEDSKYIFNKLKVKDEGTYNYKIVQKKPHRFKKSGAQTELDSKKINVTVTVVANNGVLVPTVTYDSNSFNNQYTNTTEDDDSIVNVPVKIDIYSNSPNLSKLNTEATIFEENMPISTVSNENSSLYEFDDLLLSPGEYNFEVKQVANDNKEWELDDEVLDVNITVNDDLSYSVQFREDISSFTNNEINAVSTTEEDAEIITGVPNTGIGKNIVIIIFGMVLISLGSVIFYKNINKGIS